MENRRSERAGVQASHRNVRSASQPAAAQARARAANGPGFSKLADRKRLGRETRRNNPVNSEPPSRSAQVECHLFFAGGRRNAEDRRPSSDELQGVEVRARRAQLTARSHRCRVPVRGFARADPRRGDQLRRGDLHRCRHRQVGVADELQPGKCLVYRRAPGRRSRSTRFSCGKAADLESSPSLNVRHAKSGADTELPVAPGSSDPGDPRADNPRTLRRGSAPRRGRRSDLRAHGSRRR